MPRPALVSTITSWPAPGSSATDPGVRPTRYSWTLISFGTPTRMSDSSSVPRKWRPYSGAIQLCRRCPRLRQRGRRGPSRMNSPAAPLIVTAIFGDGDNGWLQELRRKHYPADRNRVPAHLTLFHQLPPSAESEVARRLAAHAAAPAPRAEIAGIMNLGEGTAL